MLIQAINCVATALSDRSREELGYFYAQGLCDGSTNIKRNVTQAFEKVVGRVRQERDH